MKSSHRARSLICLVTCLFLSLALLPWGSASAQSNARLIIRRAPDLGANIIVQLSIDGREVAYLTYGHTYSGAIAPGRHVLAVAPRPNAKWKAEVPMNLEVHSGETYIFTTRNNGSGHLTLARGR